MVKIITMIILVSLMGGCSLVYDIFHPLPFDDPTWEQSGGGMVDPFVGRNYREPSSAGKIR